MTCLADRESSLTHVRSNRHVSRSTPPEAVIRSRRCRRAAHSGATDRCALFQDATSIFNGAEHSYWNVPLRSFAPGTGNTELSDYPIELTIADQTRILHQSRPRLGRTTCWSGTGFCLPYPATLCVFQIERRGVWPVTAAHTTHKSSKRTSFISLWRDQLLAPHRAHILANVRDRLATI